MPSRRSKSKGRTKSRRSRCLPSPCKPSCKKRCPDEDPCATKQELLRVRAAYALLHALNATNPSASSPSRAAIQWAKAVNSLAKLAMTLAYAYPDPDTTKQIIAQVMADSDEYKRSDQGHEAQTKIEIQLKDTIKRILLYLCSDAQEKMEGTELLGSIVLCNKVSAIDVTDTTTPLETVLDKFSRYASFFGF